MKKLISLIIASLILLNLINLASALTITSVSNYPAEIQPGEKTSLKITIKNNLNDNVEDATISLDLVNVPFAPYQSSSQFSFDEIKEDKSKDASFDLVADSNAESGTYKIPVNITYTINDERKGTSGLVSLIVYAEPKLSISSDSNVLLRGKNNQLAVKVINSGLGDAKFLNLKINEVSGIKILGSNSVYMGNLDSDDFDTAGFNVFINSNAGLINLPVTLTYSNSRNNQTNENLNLLLKTYTDKEAVNLGLIQKSNTAMIITGIAVLIVLFLVYRYVRKRLKKRKLEQEG